ncbi:DUF2339 domain-containing protein [Arenibacter echinorum]|uniref:Putative membrane protein DUF2339 n=1 Tax=Arenibacter echinorum TaxID=440515 RepID=A0A327R8I6_9FLAO|nr:DUF2339 domain-containing protein [Arenibacter echinorum]RAJ12485.1 putative membrane protein DUF2339 [Arenibacter echinorum]
MTDSQDQINLLLERLELLLKRQDEFSKEINILRKDINLLRETQVDTSLSDTISTTAPLQAKESTEKVVQDSVIGTQPAKTQVEKELSGIKKTPILKLDIEKFIGENLINKIGIVITVIGVAIGAKYSIEHELISPLTRIILGYLAGAGLLGFGIKLKQKFENYSAVLVSGAMAIFYFITFAAFSFYNLFPQGMAFALMVVFTVFTVVAAINYNRQVIALIGLVGAYAIPFLLSEGSNEVMVLFSYMAIINIGILIIAFKKYWKPLYYSSFGLTWLMFFVWFISKYETEQHFGMAMTFLSLFFLIFYMAFLGYKLLQKEKFGITDVILLLFNSMIFFGLGYSILHNQEAGKQLLGLFTLINALIHFVVGFIIYRQKLADVNLFYFIIGLVLVFITIAIPVQLNGNWVTLLWAGEATLLFWLGRSKHVTIYEKLSYPLMLLAVFSIFEDWSWVYGGYDPADSGTKITPLLNLNFLTSLLTICAFGYMYWIDLRERNSPNNKEPRNSYQTLISYSIPVVLVLIIYFALRIELVTYWDQLYLDSALVITPEGHDQPSYFWDYNIRSIRDIWTINYTLLFVSAFSLINIKKLKSHQLGVFSIVINCLVIAFFLFVGLYELSELRESYLDRNNSQYYHIGTWNIIMRYVSYIFVGITLLATYWYNKQEFLKLRFNIGYDLLLYISLLWISSSELINWMDILEFAQSYKLGLSILWGVYALLLIVLGIWKNKKHLRIMAFALFGVTLIKLFLYDISHLDTLAKTIVFVSLGVLLLIISFLYNKYKHIITNETKE